MRQRQEETNLLSVAHEELLLRYASRRGYLRFARVNRCKVSHDEVIGVGRALGKGGSPYKIEVVLYVGCIEILHPFWVQTRWN